MRSIAKTSNRAPEHPRKMKQIYLSVKGRIYLAPFHVTAGVLFAARWLLDSSSVNSDIEAWIYEKMICSDFLLRTTWIDTCSPTLAKKEEVKAAFEEMIRFHKDDNNQNILR